MTIDLETLGEEEKVVIEKCKQKLRRSTTLTSYVELSEAEKLGDTPQYAAEAWARMYMERALPPELAKQLPGGTVDPNEKRNQRLILRCVESTPLLALTELFNRLG